MREGSRGNSRISRDDAVPAPCHGARRRTIHDVAACARKSRGWSAGACPRSLDPGADHDTGDIVHAEAVPHVMAGHDGTGAGAINVKL